MLAEVPEVTPQRLVFRLHVKQEQEHSLPLSFWRQRPAAAGDGKPREFMSLTKVTQVAHSVRSGT